MNEVRKDQFGNLLLPTDAFSHPENQRQLVKGLRRLAPSAGATELMALAFLAAEIVDGFADLKESETGRLDLSDDEPPAKPKKKKAGVAAGGERKRAARGLPPCARGGRHTWNELGWCSKCGNVHRDGKVQTEVPGASPPVGEVS